MPRRVVVKGAKVAAVTAYWFKFFISKGLCGLCGNHGVIDTRDRATSNAGVPAGGRFCCICPNGQALRRAGYDPEKDQ